MKTATFYPNKRVPSCNPYKKRVRVEPESQHEDSPHLEVCLNKLSILYYYNILPVIGHFYLIIASDWLILTSFNFSGEERHTWDSQDVDLESAEREGWRPDWRLGLKDEWFGSKVGALNEGSDKKVKKCS